MHDLLTTAMEMHQAGHLAPAAQLYEQVLSRETENADALHLLGVVHHQRGSHARAVELICRAVALRPNIPAFHSNLAEAYRALGQLDRAAGCCRTALRLCPDHPEAANGLGLVLLDQGKIEEAMANFEAALRQRPGFALAENNLGNCCRLKGDTGRAIAHFRHAVEMDPELAEAHANLGQSLIESGEKDEAVYHCRAAVRLRADSPESHNNLGNALRAQGQLADARASYAEAIRLNPDLALPHRNMGQVLQEEGKFCDAVFWYRQALELDPKCSRIHCFLASALEEQEIFDEAADHYERAIELQVDFAEAHNGLGWVRHEQGHFPHALEHYRAALAIEPDFPAAQCNLAYALEELGEFNDAERVFREVIARHPQHVGAHAQLAIMLRGKLPQADERALENLLADGERGDSELGGIELASEGHKPSVCSEEPADGEKAVGERAAGELGDGGRMGLHFALAQVHDARGAYGRAAEHLRHANALASQLQRGRSTYDPAEHCRFVDNLLAAFTPTFFERVSGFGADTERPVFIVGLPRSGTTLTEQILAGHSQAFGAGELRLARDDFRALGGTPPTEAASFENLGRLDQIVVKRIAEQHLERLQSLNSTADRVVDKMPDNYLHLGLLTMLFPRAKFIHCRRDLRDVAASCWMTNFRHIRWANDFGHIASRFQQYERLMDHWRRVLPVEVMEVRYEETVADLERAARRLLDWCGLGWEPACLAFHEGKRPIRTASVVQVRQPVYQRSVGRWKNYDRDLGPLFARLGFEDTVAQVSNGK